MKGVKEMKQIAGSLPLTRATVRKQGSLRRLLRVLAIVGTVAALAAAAIASAADAPRRPNIVIILGDDLGFADMGAFGSEIKTPNLDSLAGDGVRFTSFYTHASCSPTRSMLLSGVDTHLSRRSRNQTSPNHDGFHALAQGPRELRTLHGRRGAETAQRRYETLVFEIS